jgi:hypothetical protein
LSLVEAEGDDADRIILKVCASMAERDSRVRLKCAPWGASLSCF